MTNQVLVSDSAGPVGNLSIFIRPEGHDVLLPYFVGENRITDTARKYMAQLATQTPATLSPNPITSFKVGTGGATQTLNGSELDLFVPLDPSTYLYTGAVTYSFSDAPKNMVAVYAFEVATTELNGYALSEVGLFCNSNWFGNPGLKNMFNIKLFSPITKTSAFALVFQWTVNFSGAC